MLRQFIVVAGLVALGVISVGSIESARMASAQFDPTDGRSLTRSTGAALDAGTEGDPATPQLVRMPKIALGR